MDFDRAAAKALQVEESAPPNSEVIPLEAYMDDYEDLGAAEGLAPAGTPAAEPARKFEFFPVGEMVAHLKPINWLVRSIIERDSVISFYGPPGAGKSLAAQDIACSVATGTPWHGHQVHQGAVFYLAGEGFNGLARRFRAWGEDRQEDLAEAPLYVSKSSAALTDPLDAARVVSAVEDLVAGFGIIPAIIVIDTLARNFGAADENSTADMNRFISHVDGMLRQRWGCCVLIVHHSGKDSNRGARGSTALRGAVDAEYEVSREEGGPVRMVCRKMKDADIPAPLAFTIEGVKLPLLDEDGEPVFGPVLCPSEYEEPEPETKITRDEQIGLDHLTEEWKAYRIWRDDWFFDAEKVPATRGKNRGKRRSKEALRPAFNRTLHATEEKGLIEVERSKDGEALRVRLARVSGA